MLSMSIFFALFIVSVLTVVIFQTFLLQFILLRLKERTLGFVTLFKTVLVVGTANVITPFKVGTLFTRPFILKKVGGIPFKKSYVALAIEQMMETPMEAIVFIAAIYLIGIPGGSSGAVIFLSMLIFLGTFLIFYSKKIVKLVDAALTAGKRMLPEKLIRILSRKKILKVNILKVLEDMQNDENKTRDVSVITLSSLAILFFSPLQMYFFFKAVSFDLGYEWCFFVFWSSVFVGRVSGVPGGFVAREGSMVLMLTSLGRPLVDSVQFVAIFRLLSTLIVIIPGVIASVSLGIPILKRRKDVKT